jgi:hypothetical protein
VGNHHFTAFGITNFAAISAQAGLMGRFSRFAAEIASSKMIRADMLVKTALFDGNLRSAIPMEERISYFPRRLVTRLSGQDDLYPPSPSPEVEAAGGLAKVGRERAGAREKDDV